MQKPIKTFDIDNKKITYQRVVIKHEQLKLIEKLGENFQNHKRMFDTPFLLLFWNIIHYWSFPLFLQQLFWSLCSCCESRSPLLMLLKAKDGRGGKVIFSLFYDFKSVNLLRFVFRLWIVVAVSICFTVFHVSSLLLSLFFLCGARVEFVLIQHKYL